MNIVDFGTFTFCGETIMDIRDLVFDAYAKNPDFNATHNVVSGIVANKELGFIGEPGMVGIANQGCDPTSQDWKVPTRKVVWEPKEWEVRIEECWKNLLSTAAVYAMNLGKEVADLTDTEWASIIAEALQRAMDDFRWRLAWFSDVDAKNVGSGSGIITAGVPIKFFTIIDGLWKQIFLQAEANPTQRVVIEENEGDSYDGQVLNADNVQGYLRSLIAQAPMELRIASDREFLVTQSVYDAYASTLQNVCCHERTYDNLVNGVPPLYFDGVPVVAIPTWDKMIKAYEDNGTSYHLPHRAIFTSREILGFGLDKAASFDEWSMWYEKKDRKVYIEAMGKSDAKLLNPSLLTVAY